MRGSLPSSEKKEEEEEDLIQFGVRGDLGVLESERHGAISPTCPVSAHPLEISHPPHHHSPAVARYNLDVPLPAKTATVAAVSMMIIGGPPLIAVETLRMGH